MKIQQNHEIKLEKTTTHTAFTLYGFVKFIRIHMKMLFRFQVYGDYGYLRAILC